MEIPLMKQPGIDRHTQKSYRLIVYLDDAISNRWIMTEQARLRCTCEEHHSRQTCRHIKERQGEFLRWKRAALQRLRVELCQGQPIETQARRLSSQLNLPLELAEFILLEDGRIAVQFDQGLSLRHSDGCSWGTMGAQAHLSKDPSKAGLFYLLSQEMGFEQLDPPALAQRLLPLPLTLPPSLFKDSTGNASSQHHEKAGLYSGQKGVVMMTDRSPSTTYHASPDAWASYWARLCGLELVGAGWSGVDRYLPGGCLDGNPVSGLAIDLANRRVMGLSAEALVRYTANIPANYQRQIAHVHLPWGSASETANGAMVIVRNPNRMQFTPDDDLVVMTTNFWQSSTCPESPEVQNLIELTAAYLVRMGLHPNATIFHGSWSQQLGQLARNAEERSDEDASCLDLTENGFLVLREKLVPALLGKEMIPALAGDFGPGWVQFLPPG